MTPTARKTPQDRRPRATPPPASPTLNDDGSFDYHASDGSVIPLPPMTLSAGFVRQNRNKSDADLIFLFCEQELDAETLAMVDALPAVEINRMWKNWTEANRASLPE
jgi:hypothetical protein